MAYTYLIGWSLYNKFYYGARWAKNCDPTDLWKTYFTSSKHVKQFRKLYGEPDIIQIRKIFSDPDKCRIYEKKMLEKLNVLNEDKWLNKNINGAFLPYGPQSSDHKNKRIAALREWYSKNTKIVSVETREKMSRALKGRKNIFSEQHKKNLHCHKNNKTIIVCPHCNKSGNLGNMKRWHFDNCKLIPQ